MSDVNTEKPMTATERKALEKLIDHDFDNLEADLHAMAVEAEKRAIEEVKEEFTPRNQDVSDAQEEYRLLNDSYQDEKTELERRFRDDKIALLARWNEKGVIYVDSGDRYGNKAGSFTVDGMDEAIKDAKNDVNAELANARRLLNKKRNDTHRQVLLDVLVTSQARSLVASIPPAKELFQQAREEQKALEAGKE